MELITVKQAAELKGCSMQYLRKQIAQGKLQAQETGAPANNKKQYMIAVEDLPPELQSRYYAGRASGAAMPPVIKKDTQKIKRAFEEYTEDEREQIRMWNEIIEEWLEARSHFKNKTDADALYISACKLKYRDLDLSGGTLYRKYKAYKEGDLDGLTDRRGGWNKGTTSIPEDTWNWFLYAYLDQRQLPIRQCYVLALDWTAEFKPEVHPMVPSEATFRRQVEKIAKSVVTLGRLGDKAYDDRCAPYIMRIYDNLEPNEYWIADNHTLDIITKYDDREVTHRMSLTAFIDARSGVMVGWNLTDNPCSQSTVLALRHAIMRYGIPRNVYFDNGSEFLCYDIAGRGHRSRKSMSLIDNPPPIFERLGIRMTNAIVKNAKAKPIERTFGTFKGTISRMFETFCGGNILERPESLKTTLKKGGITTDSKLRDIIAEMIDGTYNVASYGGAVAADKGKPRCEVWNEYIVKQRIAPPEELTLLLARSSRPQTVGRNGVYLTICGERLEYWDEGIMERQGEKVYVRYDPDNLQSVRLYEAATDRFISTLPLALDTTLFFADSNDNVSVAMERIRKVRKATRGKLNEYRSLLPPDKRIDILDMQIRRAHSGMERFNITSPKCIEMVSSGEQREDARLASGSDVVIDMTRMTANAQKRKGNIINIKK